MKFTTILQLLSMGIFIGEGENGLGLWGAERLRLSGVRVRKCNISLAKSEKSEDEMAGFELFLWYWGAFEGMVNWVGLRGLRVIL